MCDVGSEFFLTYFYEYFPRSPKNNQWLKIVVLFVNALLTLSSWKFHRRNTRYHHYYISVANRTTFSVTLKLKS